MLTEERAHQIAEDLVNDLFERGLIDTEWMNPEDKEMLIAPIAAVILSAISEAIGIPPIY